MSAASSRPEKDCLTDRHARVSDRTKPGISLPKTPSELVGTIHAQRVRCGKASCRCASGDHADLHGPYYYRFWREGGRLRKAYVPRSRIADTRAACARRQDRERRQREARRELRSELARFRSLSREVEALLRIWQQR